MMMRQDFIKSIRNLFQNWREVELVLEVRLLASCDATEEFTEVEKSNAWFFDLSNFSIVNGPMNMGKANQEDPKFAFVDEIFYDVLI